MQARLYLREVITAAPQRSTIKNREKCTIYAGIARKNVAIAAIAFALLISLYHKTDFERIDKRTFVCYTFLTRGGTARMTEEELREKLNKLTHEQLLTLLDWIDNRHRTEPSPCPRQAET